MSKRNPDANLFLTQGSAGGREIKHIYLNVPGKTSASSRVSVQGHSRCAPFPSHPVAIVSFGIS